MSQGIWATMIVILGIVGVVIINNFTQISVMNEQDYYLVKETTEAAMYDAIDLVYYRKTGELKIIEEKFVENFLRRYAENSTISREGTVIFNDIVEKPPKVSVTVGTKGIILSSSELDIKNSIDAILETK